VIPSPKRTLLIDDESPARDDLRRLLLPHREVVIVGEAGRIADAQAALTRENYDLVFLDVQLRGGTGFDLVPHVRAGARIVFVTGHDQYALRAFAVNALDYLLKPVEAARLAETLRRLDAPAASAPAPALCIDDETFLKTDAHASRFVRLRDIAVIFSSENYSELRLADHTRLLVRRTMKAWEQQLPSPDFMRVHRTALVNLHAVQRSAHRDGETTHLFVEGLAPEQPVRARRELWPEIERRLVALKK